MKKYICTSFTGFLLLLFSQICNAQCHASFTWEQIPGSLQLHFHSTSTSEHDIVSYLWNFGDGHQSDGSNPYHTFDAPGNYLVCLVIHDSEGCVSDVCHEVTVEAVASECHAAFVSEVESGSCSIQFHSQSTSNHEIVSHHWNFGDGHDGNGAHPSHTYSESGTYVVCLVIEDNAGCASDVCHEVTVECGSEPCQADFVWEQIPGTFQLHFHSTSTSEHDIVSYHWNFGDGHQGDGSNPYHTYQEPGTYVVCLLIQDASGCASDVCYEVTVTDIPTECHAAFEWEVESGSCVVHFHSQSTSNHDIESHSWSFGDGHFGDGAHPVHTYAESGTYVVCLAIEDNAGCASDICHEVTVECGGEPCQADFVWEQIPGSFQLHFHSASTSQHDIVSYHWNFGDGHQGDGSNPYHTYQEPGTYVVCLVIHDASGCVSDICYEVTVTDVPTECHAALVWETESGSCTVQFHSQSTSNHDIVSHHWNFGDGHNGDGAHPSHTYAESGTYVVCLLIEDNAGCASDICHEVTVECGSEPCHADFVWEQIPGSLQLHFHSASTSGYDIVSYLWNFGDGHQGDGSNPYHTYEEPGTYVVCLLIQDASGCASDICYEVTVHEASPACEAYFTQEENQNDVVIFHNQSSGSTPHTMWLWHFGDGHSSTEENPHHEYAEPGFYTVCLIMTDSTTGCEDDFCHTVAYNLEWEDLHQDARPADSQFGIQASDFFAGSFVQPKYTNPANSEIRIDFDLQEGGVVVIELYDWFGKRWMLSETSLASGGRHSQMVDVRNIPAGLYFLRFVHGANAVALPVSIAR